jgi:hypothetical protein
MIGLWFSQEEDGPASNNDKNFVAGFQTRRLASLTRDHDLALCRKGCFRQRFTLKHKVEEKKKRILP